MLHIIVKGLGNIQKTPLKERQGGQTQHFLNIYMKIIYLQPHIFFLFLFFFNLSAIQKGL